MAILSLVLSMLVIPPVSAVEPVPDVTWYVDSSSGNDWTGDGSIGNPFGSITAAITTASAGDTIKVATDTTYTIGIAPPLLEEGAPPPNFESFPLFPLDGMTITTYGDGERPVLDAQYASQIMRLSGVEGVTIGGLRFTRGSSFGGAGIGIYDSVADINDCWFDSHVSAFGPGLDLGGSDVWMEGCTFERNGWAPDEPKRWIDISAGAFDVSALGGDGVVASYGGAISAMDSWFVAWDCTIHDNAAMIAGGGIYAADSFAAVVDSDITSNTAAMEPGGMTIVDPPEATDPDLLPGVVVPEEYAGAGGGVAAVGESMLVMWGDYVYDNTAWMPAGVYVDTMSTYEMYECEVASNTATFKGGGVASFPWVDPSMVTDAAASGTFDLSSDSRPTDLVRPEGRRDFTLFGGTTPEERHNYVGRTVFDKNVAPYGSGLTSIMDDPLWVENSLFTHNDTSDEDPDAVVSLMFNEAEMWNNTFSQNLGLRANIVNYTPPISAVTDDLPPPIVPGGVTVENSVFWDNETIAMPTQSDAGSMPENGAPLGFDTEGCWVDNSDSPLGDYWFSPGPSNIATDPLFADPATDDFRLGGASPCVDSALTTETAPWEDLLGLERPFDGDDDGQAEHDMGCYEFYPVSRVDGDNRYGTAVQISSASFESADTVVLATGEVFADGLAASGLCGVNSAPLLLTRPDLVPTEVMAEIARLGATDVIVVGGTSAVHETVVQQLQGAGLTVDRIGGTDRYETAVLIAQEILSSWGEGFPGLVFVARGDRFPDALSVSPAAFWNEAPVLLVSPDSLPEKTVEIMETIPDAEVIIAGGKEAVNSHVAKGLSLAAGDATRVSGADRYETAAALSEFFVAQGWTGWAYTALATGEQFADALTGGVAVGYDGGVMLLTPGASLHPATEAALVAHKAEIARFEVLGGGVAVSPSTMAAATAALN